MKKLILIVLMICGLGNAKAFEATQSIECHHIQFTNIDIDKGTGDPGEFGFLYSEMSRVTADVVCMQKHEKYGKVLGEVKIKVRSFGLTLSWVYAYMKNMYLDGLAGKPLKHICGTYTGSKIGASVIGGGTALRVTNHRLVNLSALFVNSSIIPKADNSFAWVKVSCLEKDDVKWETIIN